MLDRSPNWFETRLMFMVFNATFNNISVISWRTFVLSYYVPLRSELRVVMSVTISALKTMFGSSKYLQLFVGGFMSWFRYLCLFVYSDVWNILCCVFVLFFWTSCVPYVASFCELFICDYFDVQITNFQVEKDRF